MADVLRAPGALTHVPELAALETLLAVARTGSMSRAAAELRVSQQAVSSRVVGAERLVGVAVFHRSTRGVVPTAAGQAVVAWAQEVVDAARAFEDGVVGIRPQQAPVLRLAASNTVSECLLPSWAGALRRRNDGISVQARSGNSEMVLALVSGGEVDLGFVECPVVPRTLRARTVGADELVVVAPDHRWARQRQVTRAELAATALVMREPGSGTRARFTQACPQHIDPVAELTSRAAVRDAVGTLGAPAVLSSLAVRADVVAGRLVVVAIDGLAMPRRLRAVWNPRQRPSGAAAELLAIAAAGNAPQRG